MVVVSGNAKKQDWIENEFWQTECKDVEKVARKFAADKNANFEQTLNLPRVRGVVKCPSLCFNAMPVSFSPT